MYCTACGHRIELENCGKCAVEHAIMREDSPIVDLLHSRIGRFELFETMVESKLVRYTGLYGYIMAIELEDGSGRCFNVTFRAAGSHERRKVFVRCR